MGDELSETALGGFIAKQGRIYILIVIEIFFAKVENSNILNSVMGVRVSTNIGDVIM